MLRVGAILRGIYRIDSYLSSGGFGNTYVATNIEFDERVAIKEFFMKGVTQREDNQTTVSVSNIIQHGHAVDAYIYLKYTLTDEQGTVIEECIYPTNTEDAHFGGETA